MNIAEHCLTKSAEQSLVAGSLVCRSNAEAKAAALKAAAVYLMIAGWAESMDSAALADRCTASADDYMRSAKPYAKRASSPQRAAYVKGAAVLREIAGMAGRDAITSAIERTHEAIHEHDAQAVAQGARVPEADGQAMETAEGTDPAEGQVPVPVLPRRRTRTRGNGSRSQDPAVQGRDGQAGEPGLDVP